MDAKSSKPVDTDISDVTDERADDFSARAKPHKRARIRVGGVYVMGDRASAAQRLQAVAASADILERLGTKIVQPGVQLKAARGIPLFFADPGRAGRFLRELDGKTEGGVLENGAFKVLD